uniref:RNase H type-1 domain-containing protein n=1 Tax=Nelumbo nucifera TaxID=4432 RepID=A0A822YMV9_NELNU|nr:TPA_asm: hypothetical protein HUJ06_011087 [Nelumbo nucifera]
MELSRARVVVLQLGVFSKIKCRLVLVWNSGHKIILKSDSRSTIQILKGGRDDHWRLSTINEEIKALLNRDWKVHINHCYREANRCANFMANLAWSTKIQYREFLIPPRELNFLMFADVIGVVTLV